MLSCLFKPFWIHLLKLFFNIFAKTIWLVWEYFTSSNIRSSSLREEHVVCFLPVQNWLLLMSFWIFDRFFLVVLTMMEPTERRYTRVQGKPSAIFGLFIWTEEKVKTMHEKNKPCTKSRELDWQAIFQAPHFQCRFSLRFRYLFQYLLYVS